MYETVDGRRFFLVRPYHPLESEGSGSETQNCMSIHRTVSGFKSAQFRFLNLKLSPVIVDHAMSVVSETTACSMHRADLEGATKLTVLDKPPTWASPWTPSNPQWNNNNVKECPTPKKKHAKKKKVEPIITNYLGFEPRLLPIAGSHPKANADMQWFHWGPLTLAFFGLYKPAVGKSTSLRLYLKSK